jgi:hypothetical protein
MTHDVWRSNAARIRKAGGIAYNINTNVKDGCNSYSNRGRLYELVQDMKASGFPVNVNVFESCGHGYCAYRYPNGHQSLYWFSKQFKRNFLALGINRNSPREQVSPGPPRAEREPTQGQENRTTVRGQTGRLPGLW